MKKSKALLLMAALGLSLTACERHDSPPPPPPEPKTESNIGEADADNTGRNVRDRDFTTPTSGDQGENDIDLTITQHIRKAVVGDKNFSSNAKNSKIITIDRNVTLRGVVESDQEKQQIEKIAKGTSHVKNVDNFLEVKKNNDAKHQH